eukprot:TRINITY_DN1159_c0_g1_i1.p1 TRINITY_DN1159_c0_g1~~TRINITY_DN1159_c0_g1_i1.p1  ORF type:complete len:648 (-),score=0.11 TRINITY_DN1159_c0_g1_i1:106-2049(-)
MHTYPLFIVNKQQFANFHTVPLLTQYVRLIVLLLHSFLLYSTKISTSMLHVFTHYQFTTRNNKSLSYKQQQDNQQSEMKRKQPENSILENRYPSSLFLDRELAESFQCPICHMIPSHTIAVDHTKCGSVFCKPCLDQWLTNRTTCPTCRGRLASKLTKDRNYTVYKVHQKLSLRCPAEQCNWTGSMEKLKQHKEVCQFIAKPCKYQIAGCSFVGTGEELKNHEKEQTTAHLEACMKTIIELKGKVKKIEDEKERVENPADEEIDLRVFSRPIRQTQRQNASDRALWSSVSSRLWPDANSYSASEDEIALFNPFNDGNQITIQGQPLNKQQFANFHTVPLLTQYVRLIVLLLHSFLLYSTKISTSMLHVFTHYQFTTRNNKSLSYKQQQDNQQSEMKRKQPENSILENRYPSSLFLDRELAESFQCPICHMIPSHTIAVDHTKCGSVFCKPCLDQWLTNRTTCPTCRGRLASKLTKDRNYTVYKVHQKLSLRCPAEQCNWTGSMEKLKQHKEVCQFIAKPCKYQIAGCSFVGTGEELKNHEKEQTTAHLEACMKTIIELKGKVKKIEDEKERVENPADEEIDLRVFSRPIRQTQRQNASDRALWSSVSSRLWPDANSYSASEDEIALFNPFNDGNQITIQGQPLLSVI